MYFEWRGDRAEEGGGGRERERLVKMRYLSERKEVKERERKMGENESHRGGQ